MKKITSMFLALVMALALAVPAFASSNSQSLTVEGAINLPTISVVLPTAASLTLNPYGLEVKLNKTDTTGVNDKVISPTLYVKNLSNIGVQAIITATGTVGKGSNAAFMAAKPESTDTDKGAFIYGVFKIQDNVTDTVDALAAGKTPGTEHGTVVVSAAATDDDEDTHAVKGYANADTASTAAATINQLSAVNPADAKNPAAGGVLAFRFFGDTVSEPTKEEGSGAAAVTVADPWTEKDVMSVALAFTFKPVVGAGYVAP